MCWTNKLILFLIIVIVFTLLYLSNVLNFDILVGINNGNNSNTDNTDNNDNNGNNGNNTNTCNNETFMDTNNLERLDENQQCPMYVYYNKSNYFMIFKNLPYRSGVNPIVFSSLDDVKNKINELNCPTVIIDSIVDKKNNIDVRDNYKYICNRKVGANIYNLDKNIFDSQYQALQNKLELINNGSAFDRYDIATKNNKNMEFIKVRNNNNNTTNNNNNNNNNNNTINNNNITLKNVLSYKSDNVDKILDDLYKLNDTKEMYNLLKELLESKDVRNQQNLDVEKCQLLDMGATLNMGDSLYRFNDLYNKGNITNETNESLDLNITKNDVKDVLYQHYMSNKFLTPENDAKIFI